MPCARLELLWSLAEQKTKGWAGFAANHAAVACHGTQGIAKKRDTEGFPF